MPFNVHLKDINVCFPGGWSRSGLSSTVHRGVICTVVSYVTQGAAVAEVSVICCIFVRHHKWSFLLIIRDLLKDKL